MAKWSRWWAWQHLTIIATPLLCKIVCTTSKAAPFLSFWNWNWKKKWWNPHLFWIWMDLIKLESAITLEQTIQNWQKWSLPKIRISSNVSGEVSSRIFRILSRSQASLYEIPWIGPIYKLPSFQKWKLKKKEISKISARDKRYKNSYRTILIGI